eukprot:SAG31_NODE_7608_length_1642_cov_2.813999_3_plen_98_part_00
MGVMEKNMIPSHSPECAPPNASAPIGHVWHEDVSSSSVLHAGCKLTSGKNGKCDYKGYSKSGPLVCKMSGDQTKVCAIWHLDNSAVLCPQSAYAAGF